MDFDLIVRLSKVIGKIECYHDGVLHDDTYVYNYLTDLRTLLNERIEMMQKECEAFMVELDMWKAKIKMFQEQHEQKAQAEELSYGG